MRICFKVPWSGGKISYRNLGSSTFWRSCHSLLYQLGDTIQTTVLVAHTSARYLFQHLKLKHQGLSNRRCLLSLPLSSSSSHSLPHWLHRSPLPSLLLILALEALKKVPFTRSSCQVPLPGIPRKGSRWYPEKVLLQWEEVRGQSIQVSDGLCQHWAAVGTVGIALCKK